MIPNQISEGERGLHNKENRKYVRKSKRIADVYSKIINLEVQNVNLYILRKYKYKWKLNIHENSGI